MSRNLTAGLVSCLVLLMAASAGFSGQTTARGLKTEILKTLPDRPDTHLSLLFPCRWPAGKDGLFCIPYRLDTLPTTTVQYRCKVLQTLALVDYNPTNGIYQSRLVATNFGELKYDRVGLNWEERVSVSDIEKAEGLVLTIAAGGKLTADERKLVRMVYIYWLDTYPGLAVIVRNMNPGFNRWVNNKAGAE